MNSLGRPREESGSRKAFRWTALDVPCMANSQAVEGNAKGI
jgi:hypothetical protein